MIIALAVSGKLKKRKNNMAWKIEDREKKTEKDRVNYTI